MSGLSRATRTSVEVVRSAYATAVDGFGFPYGDITVGGYRNNTPYVVIQNVGAYLDLPRFLDSDHPIETSDDAEAYLARLQSYAKQLDGGTGAHAGGARRGSRATRVPGRQDARTDDALHQEHSRRGDRRRLARPAHEGQGSRRRLGRARAGNRDPGHRPGARAPAGRASAATHGCHRRRRRIWARPHGEAIYRWALAASTNTTMSPDEVHGLGRTELTRLQAQMDALLKEVGYQQGTVSARMSALTNNPRYKFSPGDKGRAGIMAFIEERLAWVRTQMPRAFNTVVNPNIEVRRLPPEEELGAASLRQPGSIDGRIPGRF